jgi:hypothetical protein
MLAYVLSFGLVAVSRESASVPGYMCAYATLVNTLVAGRRSFDGKTAVYIAMLMSGWINIAFLASMAIWRREGTRRAFKILRTITLLMIPACWIVSWDERLVPREGHFLWIAGMVVALFSDRLSSRR